MEVQLSTDNYYVKGGENLEYLKEYCNKELCITHTVEHNYISSSSTVEIQLYVSTLYVVHLQVVI